MSRFAASNIAAIQLQLGLPIQGAGILIMKKFAVGVLAALLWLSLGALGQDTPQQQSADEQKSTTQSTDQTSTGGQEAGAPQSGEQQGAMTKGTDQSSAAGKKAGSGKLSKLKGKISDDGKTFTSDKDSKSWTIENPEAVKGHEGHEVSVRAHVDADKNSMNVMSLKMAGERASKGKKSEPMSEQPPKY